VRKAQASGNNPVNTAARASALRAIRAKTGTTGAKGDAASKTNATATSLLKPNPRTAATASAGTTIKLRSKIATSGQSLRAFFTSP
jgi:hypothetical protein